MFPLNEAQVRLGRKARSAFIASQVGLLAIAGLLLWQVLFFVLAGDRGLDLTDEGLYLLAARPPSLSAAWGTPAGWHTAPLFRAVAYDVAPFRTLGAVLLVVSAGALGYLAVAVGQRIRETEPDRRNRSERAFGALLGGLSGFLHYGGLVRTPSYNWLTVLGSTLAVLGLLQIASGNGAADV